MTVRATELLQAWRGGDEAARDRVIALLYAELRSIAARHLSGERGGHLLQPTALVHEAYQRLASLDRIEWCDRSHFLAMSARIMREVLLDHARRRDAAKRDGGQRVTLSGLTVAGRDAPDLLDLERALETLARLDAPAAQLVELRYFGGLSIDECAQVQDCSPATVKRRWATARAWLYDALATA